MLRRSVPPNAIACPPALYALAAGGSGHPQDCTACGSRATTAPASAALAATARPLPGATFSPSHICAMPRCGPEGHTVLMSGSRARTRRSNRSLPILAQIGSPRTHQRCPLLGGFCCKTRLRDAGGLACEFLVVGLRCFPIEGVGASTSPTPDGTLTPDKQRVLAEHGRGAWQAASGSARLR